MSFNSGSSGGRSRTMMSEINITPMVDVMLVLLIIFMVTTPMMQQGIDVELPETANSGSATSDEPFVLEIRKNKKIFVGDLQIPEAEQVYLQADKAVDYGFVAETMADIRAAGIFNIGLVTVPKQ